MRTSSPVISSGPQSMANLGFTFLTAYITLWKYVAFALESFNPTTCFIFARRATVSGAKLTFTWLGMLYRKTGNGSCGTSSS